MPKALVATTMSRSPSAKSRCAPSRVFAGEAGVVRASPPAARGEPRALVLGLLARGRVDDAPSRGLAGARRAPPRARRRRAAPARGGRRPPRRAARGWAGRSRGRSGACRAAGRAGPGSRRARSASPSPCTRARARGAARPSERADLQVLRPEVVAPLADAVGLVDRDQRAVDLAEERRGSPGTRAAPAPRRRARSSRRASRAMRRAHLGRLERRGEKVARTPRASSAAT